VWWNKAVDLMVAQKQRNREKRREKERETTLFIYM
jgi:hypothetical protein